MLDFEGLFPVLILFVAVVVSVAIVAGLKQQEKRSRGMATKREPKTLKLKLNKEYISKKELVFLNAVHKALPAEFIAFPKVALENLFSPTGDKISYNLISGKIADVCIFTKDSMEPILVIDLVETEISAPTFNQMNAIAKKALSIAKIPVLELEAKETYDLVKLRKDLITAMPDKIVTILKQNLTK